MKKPVAALVVVLSFILFLMILAPQVMQVHSLKVRSRALETEVKKLDLQNRALENELRLLREDPVYLEKVARGKFNKAKEGEIVYKVVRDGKN